MKKCFSFIVLLSLFSTDSQSTELVQSKGGDLMDRIASVYNHRDPYRYSESVYETFKHQCGVHKSEPEAQRMLEIFMQVFVILLSIRILIQLRVLVCKWGYIVQLVSHNLLKI